MNNMFKKFITAAVLLAAVSFTACGAPDDAFKEIDVGEHKWEIKNEVVQNLMGGYG